MLVYVKQAGRMEGRKGWLYGWKEEKEGCLCVREDGWVRGVGGKRMEGRGRLFGCVRKAERMEGRKGRLFVYVRKARGMEGRRGRLFV